MSTAAGASPALSPALRPVPGTAPGTPQGWPWKGDPGQVVRVWEEGLGLRAGSSVVNASRQQHSHSSVPQPRTGFFSPGQSRPRLPGRPVRLPSRGLPHPEGARQLPLRFCSRNPLRGLPAGPTAAPAGSEVRGAAPGRVPPGRVPHPCPQALAPRMRLYSVAREGFEIMTKYVAFQPQPFSPAQPSLSRSLWDVATLSGEVWVSHPPSGALEIVNASLRFLLSERGSSLPPFQKCPLASSGKGPPPLVSVFLLWKDSKRKIEPNGFMDSLGFLGPRLSRIKFMRICKCHVKFTHLNPLMSKHQRPGSRSKMSFPPL